MPESHFLAVTGAWRKHLSALACHPRPDVTPGRDRLKRTCCGSGTLTQCCSVRSELTCFFVFVLFVFLGLSAKKIQSLSRFKMHHLIIHSSSLCIPIPHNACTYTHTHTLTHTNTHTCLHLSKCRRQVAVLRLMPSVLPPGVFGDGDAGQPVVLQWLQGRKEASLQTNCLGQTGQLQVCREHRLSGGTGISNFVFEYLLIMLTVISGSDFGFINRWRAKKKKKFSFKLVICTQVTFLMLFRCSLIFHTWI